MSRSLIAPRCRRIFACLLLFIGIFAVVYQLASGEMKDSTTASEAQKLLYPCGLGLLLGGLSALWLGIRLKLMDTGAPVGRLFFPMLSALLAFIGMGLAYIWVGMWPVGSKTGMIVDMHHQYAPLLAELRDTLLHGDSLLYTFDVGLGASYLPLFGYYLASPFNLLLLLFPENLLPEALLVITLLKNMLTAALFCAAVQYIYGKRSYAAVAVSLMYSMMMYLIAYSWNIMWLDCVMMLPLVVLGFEKLMREGKYLTYVLSLGYTLYANYYIGFMVCLFLTLYYVAFCLRRKRSMAELAGGFLRFALGSLAGGMLAMVILVPVVMALGQTSAAGGDFRDFAANFSMFDLIGQHLYSVKPTIRSGNLPNVYCGILAVLLVPVFATTKAIPARRRAAYLGLLGLLGLSMVINNFDLLWHGLHSPNDLPYRFSFIYCFFLLLIAYETLLHVRELTVRQIVGSCGAFLLYLVVEEKFGGDAYTFDTLYLSLAIALGYSLLLVLATRRRVLKEASYALILMAVVAEMVTGASAGFTKLNAQEYFTAHEHYVDNDITKATRQAVAAMERLGDSATDNGFYRLEFLPRRTSVDTALFDYNGITVFASSNSYNETRMMGGLGYAVNGVNSHLFRYFVPASDSLLGIRYIAMTDAYTPSPYLEKKDTVTVGSQSYTVYENTLALPLGYMIRPEAKLWNYSYYSPFVSQNSLLSAMTGNSGDVFRLQQIRAQDSSATVTGTYAFSMQKGQTATYVSTAQSDGRVYVHVDCRAAKSISVRVRRSDPTRIDPSTGEPMTDSTDWSVTTYEPYIVDAGDLKAGDTVSVTVHTENACSGNIYVAQLDGEALERDLETLRAGGMKVTTFTDTKIEGTVRAESAGVLFTSVPFDEGWTVTVDGKRVETYAIGDAMLAFDVEAGEHTVTMTFCPKGLWLGIGLTVGGILLLVLLCHARTLRTFTETGETLPFELPEDDETEEAAEDTPRPDPSTEAVPLADFTPQPKEAPSAPETEDPMRQASPTLEQLLADVVSESRTEAPENPGASDTPQKPQGEETP